MDFIDLPDDIILKILKGLNLSSFINLSKTNSRFFELSQTQTLWQSFLLREFGLTKQSTQLIKVKSKKSVFQILLKLRKLKDPTNSFRSLHNLFIDNLNNPLLISCLDDNITMFKGHFINNSKPSFWLDIACACGSDTIVTYCFNVLKTPLTKKQLQIAETSQHQTLIDFIKTNIPNDVENTKRAIPSSMKKRW